MTKNSNALRKRPLQARSHRLVDTILDATARMLAASDARKVTTNAIAEAAGISIGSLYRYFPDRDALIAAAIGHDGKAIFARIMAGETGRHPVDFETELAILADNVIATLRRHPPLGGPPLPADLDGHAVLDRCASATLAIVQRLETLAARTRSDVPKTALPLLAEVIYALAEVSIKHPLDSRDRADVDQIVTQAVLSCLHISRTETTIAAPETHIEKNTMRRQSERNFFDN